MLKKTLAILCALTLLVSLFSVGYIASATENTTDTCATVKSTMDFETATITNNAVFASDEFASYYVGAQITSSSNYSSSKNVKVSGTFYWFRIFFMPEVGKTYRVSWQWRDNDANFSGELSAAHSYRNATDSAWLTPNKYIDTVSYTDKSSSGTSWNDESYTFTATSANKVYFHIATSYLNESSTTKHEYIFDNFVVEEISHDISAVEAKAPTATEDGVKAHYACTKCGTRYTDAEGKTEVALADLMDRECNVVVNETFEAFDNDTKYLSSDTTAYYKEYDNYKLRIYASRGIKFGNGGGFINTAYTHAAAGADNKVARMYAYGGSHMYFFFDVTSGKEYDISFKLGSTEGAGASLTTRIRYPLSVGEYGAVVFDEKEEYTSYTATTSSNTQFKEFSYSFAATKTGTVSVQFIFDGTSDYIDDIKIEESAHTYAQVPAREADCVNDGCEEHYTCTSCGKNWADAAYTQHVDPVIPAELEEHKFENYSLRLDGKIGLGFNVKLCDGLTKEGNSEYPYAQFAIEGEEGIEKVSLKDAVKEADGSYTFYCPLSSVQMGKEVTASLCYQSNVLDTATASANDYLADLDKVDISEEAKALARATGSFTSFAEDYFAGADIEDTTLDEISVVDTNNHSVEGSVEGVEFYGYDLVLDDRTDLRLYFEAAEAPTIKVDGVAAEVKAYVEGYYYVTIPNIAAHELSKKFTVVANDGLTVEACALSYANSVIKANYNKNLVKLCKALYNYSNAAAVYNVK